MQGEDSVYVARGQPQEEPALWHLDRGPPAQGRPRPWSLSLPQQTHHHLDPGSFTDEVLFLSRCLQDFSVFSFQQFHYYVSGCAFLWVYPAGHLPHFLICECISC